MQHIQSKRNIFSFGGCIYFENYHNKIFGGFSFKKVDKSLKVYYTKAISICVVLVIVKVVVYVRYWFVRT